MRERRRYRRAPFGGNVTLYRGTTVLGEHRVRDLSVGGILLRGTRDVTLGEDLEIVLTLPPNDEKVRVPGVVLRKGPSPDGPVFALRFTALRPAQEEAIEHTVSLSLEEARTASVLIVDSSLDSSNALKADLSRLGHTAVTVTTPLDAVQLLEDDNQIEVAIVDLRLGTADGRDLLAFVAQQRPYVRRVLMADGPRAARLELTGPSLPSDCADEVLPKPWTETTLVRALGE